MWINTQQEGGKRTEQALFRECPGTGQEATGTIPVAQYMKLKQCYLNMENSLTVEGDQALKNVAQRYRGVSHPGDIKKLSGHGP